MEQKIPSVTNNDIRRIIQREFPQMGSDEIESILSTYKSATDEGSNRVYAAILKLSNGDIELLKTYVQKANHDYRDIIALAEYPNYSACAFEDDLPEEKEEQLINDDWLQYEAWFNGV